MDSSLFPDIDTRPVKRGDASSSGEASRAPELPQLPSLPPEPRQPAAVPSAPAPEALAEAKTAKAYDARPVVAACPRCRGKLTDPAGLGWCQRCGYCHSLEQVKAKVPVQVAAQTPPKTDFNNV